MDKFPSCKQIYYFIALAVCTLSIPVVRSISFVSISVSLIAYKIIAVLNATVKILRKLYVQLYTSMTI